MPSTPKCKTKFRDSTQFKENKNWNSWILMSNSIQSSKKKKKIKQKSFEFCHKNEKFEVFLEQKIGFYNGRKGDLIDFVTLKTG